MPLLSPQLSLPEHNDHNDNDDNNIYHNDKTQRLLVSRLDKRLLLFAMFSNMVKTMDNVNLATAFVSGMETDLHIVGTQYNVMFICFMVGYLMMQIPSNILLTHYRPSRYLPILELIWCILTLAMAAVQSVYVVFVFRFLLGLAEAGCFPGIIFLLGNWYTKKELGKRTSLIAMFGTLGGALSGVIQAIFLKTIDGLFGISGWRWLFIFDGILTGLVAISGYLYLPDDIHNTTWLNEKERELATIRLAVEGRQGSKTSPWKTQKIVKLLLTNKYIAPLVISWTLLNLALGASHVLGIVAKRIGYDAVAANLFTTPDMLITMVMVLGNGLISDYYRTRLWCIALPSSIGLIGCILLAAFIQPFGFLYVGFIMTHAGLASSQPIVMTWANELLTDRDVRAIAIAVMNTCSSLMYTWSPIVLWPVTDAPYYKRGFTSSVCFIVVFLCIIGLIAWIQHRNEHHDDNDDEIQLLVKNESIGIDDDLER
ncbi:major facilitator superfamily domain-containing protein [Halteromyces radiatus]|uniref:major facilitator superfamily domain-containing protein n=1 Tax=Halteromyces radiatus TaxID=101107 RepID=UPI00221F8E09|nr:major facilitator superfamily domain-containing protein [Halteromyces radiatus]KAI8083073.1 major facilitator superfamily domain-containing protein [Halteromyces radiatus]